MDSKKEFQQLKLAQKYKLVQSKGQFLASRFYESYHVHLYAIQNYYVEVWCRIGISQICWIEVVHNPETIQSYVDGINVLKDLGFEQ